MREMTLMRADANLDAMFFSRANNRARCAAASKLLFSTVSF